MNTDPDSRMYQQVDSSPVLRTKSAVSGQSNKLTNSNVQPHTQQVANSFKPCQSAYTSNYVYMVKGIATDVSLSWKKCGLTHCQYEI